MKLSYNWLKSYIDPEVPPHELCEVLTGIGLEVAGIEEVESIKGGLAGLVIGEVLTCEPHPGSDHLSKTTVSVGSGIPLSIICGAPNVAAGQKVVVAPVGTTLYPGEETLTIKKAKIRGELSEGMICSEVETQLGNDGDGIIILPSSAKVGMKASDYFHVESDWIIEIDITPNRIDSACYLGVARDLAAWFGKENYTGYRRPSVEAFTPDNHNLEIPVEVESPEAAPRYSGVTISGVTVKESPEWLKKRLQAIGHTPINNIVDITNFVLFETNQPLHAFDADAITGGKVIVKTMPAGTRFTTLDGTDRTLDAGDLMICNEEEGMCIGGVFGGIKSGVKHSTRNIFLESACFDPVFIRKTARRHGLYTDASFRFERGTDISGTIYALKRAALMIKEVAGGTISSEISDFWPNPIKGFPVEVTWYNINRLIGKEIGKESIRNILTSLEFVIEEETPRGLSLLVPTYRVDVKRECDVIEEILRFYGYNNVEIPTHVNASLNYSEHPDHDLMRNTIADQLVALGFNEIWSNSLTKASYYEKTEGFPPEETVRIFNPLSNDLNGMRQTLLFAGLEAIERNINRKNSDLRLFEFGNCYSHRGTQLRENPVGNYRETEHLALFITGNRETPNWITPETPVTLFLLKSYAENVLLRMGFDPQELETEEATGGIFSESVRYLHHGSIILELGEVAAAIRKEIDVDELVFYADFNWCQMMAEQNKRSVKFSELPRFPGVKRDLALVLDRQVRFNTLRDIAFRTERHILRSVNLFDVYEGKGVPEGKKSYAISFILRDDKKTLNDKTIDKTMERLLTAFEKEAGARLR